MKNKIFIISLILSICHGQELGVGDTIPIDFGLPLCANPNNEEMSINDSLFLNIYNGATNESGQHYVIWLNLFTSWCPSCQTEAPVTQEVYNTYQDSGLIIIGMGFDWGDPYSCEAWADNFGLTYPLLDDEGDSDDVGDEEAFNLFADCCIPHNVVINHEMEIVLTVAGFAEEEINSAIDDALNSCGILCRPPECSDIPGDIDGTYTMDNEPIIDVMDLIRLADIISLESEIDECLAVTGDLSDDGIVNLVDVMAFASMLSEGAFDN